MKFDAVCWPLDFACSFATAFTSCAVHCEAVHRFGNFDDFYFYDITAQAENAISI